MAINFRLMTAQSVGSEELNLSTETESIAPLVNVHMGALIFFLIMLIIFLWLYYGSRNKYKHYVEPLDKKQFPLKSVMSIGFYVMSMLPYKYNRKIDREMRKKLNELYDAEFNDFYLRAYWASAATNLVIGLFLTSLFCIALEGDISGLLVGLIVTFVLVYYVKQSVDKQVAKRHLQMKLAFPDVVNQLIILSGAGLTLRSAWIKVAKEMNLGSPLHKEMEIVAQQMENGVSDLIALDDMSNRCNLPEMKRFISVITQNIQRGGRDVIFAMESIGKELWDARKAAAKRMSEEAGTKLLFPMMFMLVAVIMLVAAPALISINGFQ